MGNDGGNAKAFGGVLAILAVVAGIYAIFEPMSQSIKDVDAKVIKLEESMTKDDERERKDTATMALLSEKFTEVETQFDDIERRVVDVEDFMEWYNKEVVPSSATALEKIRRLEWYMDNRAEKSMFDCMK